jgi:hypothetical protein
MSGFVVFAPSTPTHAWRPERTGVQLSTQTVYVTGMYPIYAGEASLIGRIGLEAFWKLDGFNPWDVRREDLSLRNPTT